MALTERDIIVAGVNCKEFPDLTGYIMHCCQQYKDFNMLYVDFVKTPLVELRQKIVAEQRKLVILLPEINEKPSEEPLPLEVAWHTDDAEKVKARELELRKIFRACFITDLVPVEKEIDDDDVKSEIVSLKLHAQGVMVKTINY